MKRLNLDNIYKMALSASQKLSSECHNFSEESVTSSVLYETANPKKVVFSLIKVALPIAMIVFKELVMGYVWLFMDEMKLAFPISFISTTYYAVATLLFGNGAYTLAKILATFKGKGSAKSIQALGTRLEEATETVLPEFDKQIQAAIENGEDVIFEPMEYWEVELNEHQNKFNQSQKQYKKILQITGTVLCVIAVLFAAKFCFQYIVDGYSNSYGSTSGYIVFVSYMIMAMVMATALMNLCSWYNKLAQYVMAGLFAAYQALVVIKLNSNHVFEAFKAAIASKDMDMILENCVFNYPVISLLLVTIVVVLMILTTRYDLIKDARKNGFIVPMEAPATDVHLTAEKIQNMLILKGIGATIGTMVAGAWMASIIKNGASFGGVISFLVIAIIWSVIYGSLQSDVTSAVYNKFAKYLYLMHFIGYITIVLSLLPSFGWGTIVLLAIHFVSLFILGIILAIMGVF